jgi:glycine cleavage system protein P-like pyridoxal-binding family
MHKDLKLLLFLKNLMAALAYTEDLYQQGLLTVEQYSILKALYKRYISHYLYQLYKVLWIEEHDIIRGIWPEIKTIEAEEKGHSSKN